MTVSPLHYRVTAPRWARPLALLLVALLFLSACSPTRPIPVEEQPEAAQWSRTLSAVPLRQTFLVPSEGLTTLELLLALPQTAPTLDTRPLHWALQDNTGTTIQEGTLETAGYQHNTPLRLEFAPLTPSTIVDLALTAPEEAQMALWTSSSDRYPQGTIADNGTNNIVDLQFRMFSQETPLTLPAEVRAAANRWQGVAIWLPLVLLAPGWLLAWLARPTRNRPVALFAAGLSLALAPLVYLWLSWTGLRLYEPLAQSLFQASALFLILLMVRAPSRVRDAWRSPWPDVSLVLVLVLVLGIVTWLLASRTLLAPAGESAVASGLLAQELVREGRVEHFNAPLPPSIIAGTLTQLSRQPIPSMLLLGGLLVAVSLIPALYALGMEITHDPWSALWVLPLAWLWPTSWQTLHNGDLAGLYGLALLPIAVALGLRALRLTERPWPTVALAAVPLAALVLVQGVFALGAWLLALVLWLVERALRSRNTPQPTIPLETEREPVTPPSPVSISQGLAKALFILAGAGLLLAPAWVRGFILETPAALPETYALVIATILLAALGGWVARRSAPARSILTVLAVLSLPFLLWWRSAPLEANNTAPTNNEIAVMQWARANTEPTDLFLINVAVEGDTVRATDSGMWVPLYSNHSTVLQLTLAPDLLAQAMEPGSLDDVAVRDALRAAGITHFFVDEAGGPLTADDFLNREWARVAFQQGSSYIFEFVDPLPGDGSDDI